MRATVPFAFLLSVGSLAAADPIRVSDSAGFSTAVAAAKPGDTILLAPGEYDGNFSFQRVHGTAKEPIVIAAGRHRQPGFPQHGIRLVLRRPPQSADRRQRRPNHRAEDLLQERERELDALRDQQAQQEHAEPVVTLQGGAAQG